LLPTAATGEGFRHAGAGTPRPSRGWFDGLAKGSNMTEKKGHGSAAAQKANAKAAKDGEKNPRKSSSAQAELGKKGGKAAAKK
jgi:hypothetical protein